MSDVLASPPEEAGRSRSDAEQDARQQAIKQIERRRGFHIELVGSALVIFTSIRELARLSKRWESSSNLSRPGCHQEVEEDAPRRLLAPHFWCPRQDSNLRRTV